MLKSFTINTLATLAIFFSGVTSAYATQAQSPSQIPVDVFAAPASASRVQLSPNGDAIGMLVYEGDQKVILLQNLDGSEPRKIAGQHQHSVLRYYWVNNDTIIIVYDVDLRRGHVAGRRFSKNRLYSFNRKTNDFEKLYKPKAGALTKSLMNSQIEPRIQSHIIDFLPDEPNHILIVFRGLNSNRFSVYKLDVRDGSRKLQNNMFRHAQNYYTDANHEIRIATGVEIGTSNKTFKIKTPDGEWIDNDTTSWTDDYNIINFSKDPNILFVSGTSQYNTDGIYKLDFRNGKIVEKVFEQAGVDVDYIISNQYTGEAVGVSYEKDMTEYHYFDPEYAKVYADLKEKLKGYSISIKEKARNKPLYLVSIETPQNPKAYILYDAKTLAISMLTKTRDNINPSLMSPKRRIDYAASDGTMIPAYISLPLGKKPKKLPVVIMPHGGPASRTSAHFYAYTQHLVSRGYIVFEPNFRGSTGFGDDFYFAGKKQWGGLMQEDVTDGVKWLIQNGLADPKRICIAGISYGGYAAAFADIKDPGLYACAISINGVLDIPYMKKTDKNIIGSDIWSKNMALEGAEDKSISPIHRADEINIPILLIASKNDLRVPWEHASDMHKKLRKLGKDSTYLSIKDGDHGLWTLKSRKKAMEAMEKFLAEHIGN